VKRVVKRLAINDVVCGCRPVLGITSALLCADLFVETLSRVGPGSSIVIPHLPQWPPFYYTSLPLHVAAGVGDVKLAAYFLSKGADPDMRDDSGKTALDYAQGPLFGFAQHTIVALLQERDPKKLEAFWMIP